MVKKFLLIILFSILLSFSAYAAEYPDVDFSLFTSVPAGTDFSIFRTYSSSSAQNISYGLQWGNSDFDLVIGVSNGYYIVYSITENEDLYFNFGYRDSDWKFQYSNNRIYFFTKIKDELLTDETPLVKAFIEENLVYLNKQVNVYRSQTDHDSNTSWFTLSPTDNLANKEYFPFNIVEYPDSYVPIEQVVLDFPQVDETIYPLAFVISDGESVSYRSFHESILTESSVTFKDELQLFLYVNDDGKIAFKYSSFYLPTEQIPFYYTGGEWNLSGSDIVSPFDYSISLGITEGKQAEEVAVDWFMSQLYWSNVDISFYYPSDMFWDSPVPDLNDNDYIHYHTYSAFNNLSSFPFEIGEYFTQYFLSPDLPSGPGDVDGNILDFTIGTLEDLFEFFSNFFSNLSQFFVTLYVPSDRFLEENFMLIKDTFATKFGVDNYLILVEDLENITSVTPNIGTADIFVGSSTFNDVNLINFSWYSEHKPFLDNLIYGFFIILLVFYNIHHVIWLVRGTASSKGGKSS